MKKKTESTLTLVQFSAALLEIEATAALARVAVLRGRRHECRLEILNLWNRVGALMGPATETTLAVAATQATKAPSRRKGRP